MRNTMNVKISVVMPVYNDEKYLDECLKSVLQQTLTNMEILCVDDGSTDDTIEILKQYAEKDKRIQVYEQKHSGAGAARNLGMSKATGEYLVFLDSDDFFEDTMMEKIIRKGQKTQADVILFGAKRYDDMTGKSEHVPRYLWRKLLPEQEVFNRGVMNGQLYTLTTPAPWNKAFRREYIMQQNLQFQNLPNSNDVYFTLTALGAAGCVAAIKEDLVYYRVNRSGSLQSRKDRDPLCFLEAYEAVYDELNRRNIFEDLENGFCNMVASGCVYNIRTMQSEEARWKVMEALCSERFLRMHILEHEDEYYDMPEYIQFLRGLPYAKEVRRERKRRQNFSEMQCVTDGRCQREPLVSVVISAYNVEKYIEECLENLINQTLENIEIICINDGSTDHTFEILKQYAKKDNRIRLYTQENCGLSVTRNRGLSIARGQYIYFMDSDDWMERDALEALAKRSQEYDLDVLYYDGKAFFEERGMEEEHNEFEGFYERSGEYPVCCDGKEMFCRMQKTREYRTNVGVQFFNTQYLKENGFLFQPGILHEDTDFTFKTMLAAERCGYWEKIFFHRRVRKGSIMTVKTGFEHIYGLMKSYVAMEDFLKEYPMPEEMTGLLYDVLHTVLWRAKKQYDQMTDAEQYAYEGLTGIDNIQFQILIREDTEVTKKLFRTYDEKSEINRTLQRTYKEKSEINRKLQITYGEKYDRGLEIKKLKKEISGIRNSKTYCLARMIGWPVRIIRKLMKKNKQDEEL